MAFRMKIGAGIAVALLALTGCKSGGLIDDNQSAAQAPSDRIAVTIDGGSGKHVFSAELAKSREQQTKGLMYRTDIADDQGMLFYPYPAEGTGPREASFWMKNTPTALDIVFIRPDGTIATIAENTVPYSEAPVRSGEPVGAVLELRGGTTATLGIAPGDRVSWPMSDAPK